VRALVVLDERWDSALTDLGFKVALSLLKECNVSIAALKNSPAWKKAQEEGIPLFEIADPRKGLSLKPFLTFKESVKKFKPNLVVTIRGDEMLFGALLKKSFGYRLFRIHGSARGVRNSLLNRFIHRKFVDGVIVSTKKFINSVISSVPKLTIHGIVDTEVFSFSESGRRAFRERLKVGKRKLIGIVGRLDPVKGHRLLLSAISKLRRDDFVLAVVGEEKNTKLSELKELSKKLNISDRVIFIGKRIERISDFMSACDLAVVPSVGSEVVVRAPLEFMACKTAVVSTNVGALPEVIRPPFGVAVEPDEEKLSSAINRFLDVDLEKLGELAREVAVEKYSFSSLSPVINSFILDRV
jgi:glycosyltransferase involved in cell wall biosynthesis